MNEYVRVEIERNGNGEIGTDVHINIRVDALMVVIGALAAYAENQIPEAERAKFRAELLHQINEARKELCNG